MLSLILQCEEHPPPPTPPHKKTLTTIALCSKKVGVQLAGLVFVQRAMWIEAWWSLKELLQSRPRAAGSFYGAKSEWGKSFLPLFPCGGQIARVQCGR